MWKISKFLKMHEEHSSCSSHHYLHHLNDMNNNKNLHNLVQIFSNFAHICIDYVLGSETLLRSHSSAKIQSHKSAWILASMVPSYVLSKLFLTIWCYLNLNKELILRKICQCELHME